MKKLTNTLSTKGYDVRSLPISSTMELICLTAIAKYKSENLTAVIQLRNKASSYSTWRCSNGDHTRPD